MDITFNPNNLIQSIPISTFSGMYLDKRNELKELQEEHKQEIKKYRGDERKLLQLLQEDREEEIKKVMRRLDWIIRSKDTGSVKRVNPRISVEDVKQKYPTMISLLTTFGIKGDMRRNIPCPFPDHNDKTASFKIYSDSFYCFGCKRGGDVIEFVKIYNGIDFKDVLKLLG